VLTYPRLRKREGGRSEEQRAARRKMRALPISSALCARAGAEDGLPASARRGNVSACAAKPRRSEEEAGRRAGARRGLTEEGSACRRRRLAGAGSGSGSSRGVVSNPSPQSSATRKCRSMVYMNRGSLATGWRPIASLNDWAWPETAPFKSSGMPTKPNSYNYNPLGQFFFFQ
jgi:hypothetical protein